MAFYNVGLQLANRCKIAFAQAARKRWQRDGLRAELPKLAWHLAHKIGLPLNVDAALCSICQPTGVALTRHKAPLAEP